MLAPGTRASVQSLDATWDICVVRSWDKLMVVLDYKVVEEGSIRVKTDRVKVSELTRVRAYAD